MNEENSTENLGKASYPKKFLITTFILALLSFCISTYLAIKLEAFNPKSAINQPSANFLISEKYDKGQSMEKAKATGKPIIAWFYVDWCNFCKKFAPTFDKLVKDKEIKDNFAVAFINCDKPENTELMREYDVNGFPAVYLINNKNGDKKFINNENLFAPDALKELKEEFLNFIDKNSDEKSEEEVNKTDKADD